MIQYELYCTWNFKKWTFFKVILKPKSLRFSKKFSSPEMQNRALKWHYYTLALSITGGSPLSVSILLTLSPKFIIIIIITTIYFPCKKTTLTNKWVNAMGALQRGPHRPRPTKNFGWVGHSAFGTTNNWPICSLILRNISKTDSTKCQILRLTCTKFAFRWGSARDPAEGAYSASPDTIAGFNGPTSKGTEGKGWTEEEEGNVKEREREEAGGGSWPTQKFWRGAPYGQDNWKTAREV